MSNTAADTNQDSLSGMTASGRWFVLLSPLAVIGLGHWTASLFSHFIDAWAWIPLQIVYWFAMAMVIYWIGGLGEVISAYKRISGWRRRLLGIAVGLMICPVLLFNFGLFSDSQLVIPWLLLAFINPFFEESYWRGLFGQVTQRWPALFACLYPTFFCSRASATMGRIFGCLPQMGNDRIFAYHGHGLERHLPIYPKPSGGNLFAYVGRYRKHVSLGLSKFV